MKYFSVNKPIILLLVLTAQQAHAAVKADIDYLSEWREIALQRCLSTNYEALGAFDPKKAKDFSFWTYRFVQNEKWTPNSLDALESWVDKEAGGYHALSLPVKADSVEKPVNSIFAKCMDLYRSKKLSNFLEKMLREEKIR